MTRVINFFPEPTHITFAILPFANSVRRHAVIPSAKIESKKKEEDKVKRKFLYEHNRWKLQISKTKH